MLVCMALILVACVGLTVGITLTFFGDSKSGSTEIKLGASIEFDGENGVSVATSDGLTVVPSQTVDVETTLVVKNGTDGDPTSGVLKVIPSLKAGSTGAKLTLTAGSTYDVTINGTKSTDTVMVVYNGDLYLAEKSNTANLKVFTPTTSGITIKFTVPITFPNSLGNSASGQKCTITMTGIVLQSLIHSESGEVPTTIVDFIPYFEDFSGISGPSVSVLTLGEPTIETTTIESTGTEVVETMKISSDEYEYGYIISTLNISNVPSGFDITFDYFPYVMVDSSLMSMYSTDDQTLVPVIEMGEFIVVKGSYASYEDALADSNLVVIEDCYTTSDDGVVSVTIPNSYLDNGEMSLTLALASNVLGGQLKAMGISGITVKYSNNNSTMTTTKTTQNWIADKHSLGSDISNTQTIMTDSYDTESLTYSYTNYRVSNLEVVSITLNNPKAKSVLVLPNYFKYVSALDILYSLYGSISNLDAGNFENGSVTLNIPIIDLTDFCVVEIYDPSDVTAGQSLSTSSTCVVSNITSSDSSRLCFIYTLQDDFTLSDRVTVLGVLGKNISRVVIPESHNGMQVTGIGENAFNNCTSLTSITIPSSVTGIHLQAFSDCTALTSVTFAENSQLSYIAPCTFMNCTSLTNITIPSGVTGIGSQAFDGCSALTGVTFAENSQLTSINNYAFRGCTSLTSITIPENVTSISSYAFYYCTSLTSITIPENVTSINYNTFYNCSALTSITIPASVTSIDYNAFSSCYRLAEVINLSTLTITVGSPSNGSVAYYAVRVATSGTSQITTEGDFKFVIGNDGNKYLVDYIGTSENVTIPECYGILRAFYENKTIKSVTIPSSVTSIVGAFGGNTSLTSITFTSANPPTLGYNLFGYSDDLIIYVPDEYYDTYVNTTVSGWSDYTSKIKKLSEK